MKHTSLLVPLLFLSTTFTINAMDGKEEEHDEEAQHLLRKPALEERVRTALSNACTPANNQIDSTNILTLFITDKLNTEAKIKELETSLRAACSQTKQLEKHQTIIVRAGWGFGIIGVATLLTFVGFSWC